MIVRRVGILSGVDPPIAADRSTTTSISDAVQFSVVKYHFRCSSPSSSTISDAVQFSVVKYHFRRRAVLLVVNVV